MSNLTNSIVSAVVITALYGGVPGVMIWGWVRWIRRKQPGTIWSVLSLLGLAFATVSALVAAGSILYAHSIGGFPYYDPRLMRIFRWGGLLSLAALVFAIAGVWKSNPVRWHALGCAVATLFFWFASAMGE